ncbi:MAG TPA: Asp-tRNA(Asn)/Glu-tRNA(Gln) amidotransferase subunit GatA [Polyangiales bacterium]|nr:Asp-tRNA(Asn)/Glu-tRNA(Gln) amidotransferase subunit GatA [Polyangiales bacterium]
MIELTAIEIAEGVRAGKLSAREVTEAYLARIEQFAGLNALLHVDREGALARASAIDEKRSAGRLAGVPIVIKDNLCTRGLPTTCASKILEGYVPPYDATVIERVLAEGAVPIAKANMDEFAMGSSNENSAYGAVRNPWNQAHAPGGSSGGSAAAAAARLAPLTLGSDTGGSVRQPASFCGVTAIKPTYGRVSRYGLIAFASSLDQVGPITRTIGDSARLLSVIAGFDKRDATSSSREVEDYEAALGKSIRGLRIGVVKLPAGNAASVEHAFGASLEALAAAGAELVEVELPNLEYAVATYYVVATAEASSNLARFDGMRFGLRVRGSDLNETYGLTRTKGFGPEVQRRIMLGTYALSSGYYEAYYLKAQKVRTLIAQDYARAFERCDVIATPTSPEPAFKLGEKSSDPLAMYLADIYTLPPSLAGLPALSTPAGFSPEGLPIGLQLTAPAFEEQRLISVASALESATDWAQRVPPGF